MFCCCCSILIHILLHAYMSCISQSNGVFYRHLTMNSWWVCVCVRWCCCVIFFFSSFRNSVLLFYSTLSGFVRSFTLSTFVSPSSIRLHFSSLFTVSTQFCWCTLMVKQYEPMSRTICLHVEWEKWINKMKFIYLMHTQRDARQKCSECVCV